MTHSPPPPPPQFPVNYGHADGRRRTNGPAIASLILGVLGCVPFITGLLAILLGIIGIRKTRDPLVGGKGLAIAGLILGMVSVLGWGGFAGVLGYGYLESKPAAVVAKQFLQDVSTGNINAAMAESTGFTAAQLQAQYAQRIPFGALQSVGISSFNFSSFNGQTVMHLGGTATFANGEKACTFDLVKTGGTYKVTGFRVQ
jgi:hypothetical protein